MSIEVKVPALPESVADATISAWHKQPGDTVSRDENLVDIETDKVVLEVPAPIDGVLTEIKQQQGATVTAHQLIAVLEPAGSTGAGKTTAAATPQASKAAAKGNGGGNGSDQDASTAGPAVRKLLAENDLKASQIQGSGKDGRILKEDVQSYLQQQQKSAPTAGKTSPAAAASKKSETTAPAISFDAGSRPEKRVAMTRLRARIAERLLEAQSNAAILTTFNEVNMQPVMELRNRYKDQFEKEYGVKLGFMSFFVKASVEALKKFPAVNASIDGNDIVYHGFYDIGVAVSSPRGLVVPILRNAEQMSMAAIESKIVEYGKKAKDGTLSLDEMTGGTFTVSNGGIFGSLLSTPILNPPQSGILGMHKIEERPVVEHGQIVARPMMYLALSYDHRIIDGKEAVQFLVAIKEALEDPARILLEI
ncbi:MAG TPA: 2-oxoglutarate dehydrogenase complex dihydrolipoyllysine-residue succinyltransferase [Gammaproteobacteria bacterium]|nr:2-oxoglutarate dehydrogenase complex dihydrolipoyllysine-residue succinyltransferase [Gammaproteobacteria bacterium]